MIEISSLNEAVKILREVKKLGDKAKMLGFEEAAIYLREEIIRLKEENIELRVENQELKESKRLITVKGHGWLVYEDDPEGPKFCSSCFSGKAGRTHQLVKAGTGWYCSQCKGVQKQL